MNKAEELIACLEGEIAKRDETIARLEPQLNRAIQANYDLRAELSAIKAQGVTDEQAAFEAAVAAVNERGWSTSTDLARQIWSAARLNAAPVQQVSVPGVSVMARILADRNAENCNVNKDDNWKIYGQDYIDDVIAMLAAAPAAPAADAGLVEALDRIARSAASHIEQGERPDLVTVSHWARVAYSAIDAHSAKGVL